MQYGDCPKETVVAGQADVSLRNEGAGARETFEGVEFPSLEIEFVPTKELLRRVKEMEHREIELIRMWRDAEKVDHETEERWKGMVKFVQRELQELRRLLIKEMGDEMLRKFETAVAAAERVVPKPAVRTIEHRRRTPIPTPRLSLLKSVDQEGATRERIVEPEIDAQKVDEMVNKQPVVIVRAAEGDVTERKDKM
jgi:hypothetical protein